MFNEPDRALALAAWMELDKIFFDVHAPYSKLEQGA
jgi:hypothetical protein